MKIVIDQAVIDQALEALEYPGPSWLDARQPAITALRQAIEQAGRELIEKDAGIHISQQKQEPVAWVSEIAEEAELMLEKPRFNAVALYTSPPKRGEAEAPRQPLTDEEIDRMIVANLETWNTKSAMASFIRAIEAKLKENT